MEQETVREIQSPAVGILSFGLKILSGFIATRLGAVFFGADAGEAAARVKPAGQRQAKPEIRRVLR